MKNSKLYYNKIAVNYSNQSESRLNYLDAVDSLILNELSNKRIVSYLDIGAGDGRRSIKIANALKIDSVTIIDESLEMLNNCKNLNVHVINKSFFKVDLTKKYDLITCLWNVIGHFPTKDDRILFFTIVANMLNEGGVFFFDVNNRYNITNYGSQNVMKNLELDYLKDEDSGWFTIGKNDAKTNVYIHSPFDIKEYLKNKSLELESTHYINYDSGLLEDTFFKGQLLYKLKK